MLAPAANAIDRSADRAWLEALRRRFHHRRLVSPDPLEVLYDHADPDDREVVGLIASSLAYGNVTAMLPAIRTVLERLGPRPADAIRRCSRRALAQRFRGFRYRFTPGRQVAGLLVAAARVRDDHGSLGACLGARAADEDETLVPALAGFVDALRSAAPCSLAHLLPHPADGSACKRLHLYLRWMIRRDAIDPGGWENLPARSLVVPLDTHVFRTARERGWTSRRTPDGRTALEITAVLRAACPQDPLRYDFALTRPGIRKERAADAAAPGATG